MKFSIGVGIDERMSGKEFGENWKFKMAARGSFFDEKITILPVDHHGGHKVGPIAFILGGNIAKYKDMPGKKIGGNQRFKMATESSF